MTARAFFMKSDGKKDADMGKNSLKIKMAGLAGSLMLTAVLFSGFGVAAEKNIPEPPVSQGAPASSEEEPGARLARMREFREAIQEKWNALSDEQKQELYKLAEARMNADIQLLQGLADDGILEADKVAERTGQMREHMQQLRDSGLCPFPMGRPRHIHENPDSHS